MNWRGIIEIFTIWEKYVMVNTTQRLSASVSW